jgi:hypothetical protein
VIRKIFISLMTGGLAYLITSTSNQPQIWVLTITVFISGITLAVQFMNDFEKHLENVVDKQEAHLDEIRLLIEDFDKRLENVVAKQEARLDETRLLIEDRFAKTNEATELFQALEASSLRTDVVTQLVRHSTQIEPGSPPLVYRFAQAQISRTSQFLKELGDGGEVCYDGEDHDWILDLTTQSQHTIDATSLSTVDAGGSGFSGGLWTSDLGQRYLEFQRDAMERGVIIRRLFILDSSAQIKELDFLRIYRQQQILGIHTKVLDKSTIPHVLKNLLFDFVVFDGVISYEVTPASRVEDTMKPTIVRTRLTLQADRVKERMRRFENLWTSGQEFE